MSTRLSITIATPGTLSKHGETRRAEKNMCNDLLDRFQTVFENSPQATTSFTVNDRNGEGTLTATYTPTASA